MQTLRFEYPLEGIIKQRVLSGTNSRFMQSECLKIT